MYRKEQIHDDIKSDLLASKRQVADLKRENQTLKVTIRRMEEEMLRKDKQIESLFDPQKSWSIKKMLAENGPATFFNLKEENERLTKKLQDRNAIIKKLYNDLHTTKLYIAKLMQKRKPIQLAKKQNAVDVTNNNDNKPAPITKPDKKIDTVHSEIENNNNNSKQALTAQQLKTIMENLSKKDNKRGALHNPHAEVSEIQSCFDQMLGEIDEMKLIIANDNKETAEMFQSNDSPTPSKTATTNKIRSRSVSKHGVTDKKSDISKHKFGNLSITPAKTSIPRLVRSKNQEIKRKSSKTQEKKKLSQSLSKSEKSETNKVAKTKLSQSFKSKVKKSPSTIQPKSISSPQILIINNELDLSDDSEMRTEPKIVELPLETSGKCLKASPPNEDLKLYLNETPKGSPISKFQSVTFKNSAKVKNVDVASDFNERGDCDLPTEYIIFT